ncbi:MAG: TIGR03089 family protein [Nocardioides sp.]
MIGPSEPEIFGVAPATFSEALGRLLARDAGAPLVTHYDHATDERTELSRTTYANWVAKTASYLTEECDLARGQRLALDLPIHWLGPVFLGAAWVVGLTVVATHSSHESHRPADLDALRAADAIVTGPAGLGHWSAGAGSIPVIGCALKPLGGPFTEPLPVGARDFGAEIWSQPDTFTPWDPPDSDALATDEVTEGALSHQALFARAHARGLIADGQRLLSTRNPIRDGLLSFAEVVVRRGSLVLVANPDPDRLPAVAETERVTVSDHPMRS